MATKTKAKPRTKAKPKTKAKPIPKSPAGKLNLAGVQEGNSLDCKSVTTVDEFLRTGESTAYWGQHPCVRLDDGDDYIAVFAIQKNGSFYRCGTFCPDPSHFRTGFDYGDDHEVSAVLVKSSHSQRKFDLILNGDNVDLDDPNDEPDVVLEDKSAAITASFDIFTELLAPPKGKRIPLSQILGWLNTGKIRILDYHSDETKELNPAAMRKISGLKEKRGNKKPFLSQARKSIRPPQAGFTLLHCGTGFQWHRAATILFKYGRNAYLIGQDEGTYFGCQLADHPKTIGEAYLSLIPERARKVIGPQRQGEWFAIPVPTNKVPPLEKCIATFESYGIGLPRDDKESNSHSIASEDGRISGDGVFVKGGLLSHEEHDDLILSDKQWTTFVKNTAVRSVSRVGVD